jgi:hypothetical protein
MEYAYSLDVERYELRGRTKNIKQIFEIIKKEYNILDYIENGLVCIYVGEVKEYEPCLYIDDVLDLIRKQADWEINDEEYLEDITTELKEEIEKNLNKTLLSFLKKHNLKSKNYFVKNIIKYYFNEKGILIKIEKMGD